MWTTLWYRTQIGPWYLNNIFFKMTNSTHMCKKWMYVSWKSLAQKVCFIFDNKNRINPEYEKKNSDVQQFNQIYKKWKKHLSSFTIYVCSSSLSTAIPWLSNLLWRDNRDHYKEPCGRLHSLKIKMQSKCRTCISFLMRVL